MCSSDLADREALMGEIAGAGMEALASAGRSRLEAVEEPDPVRWARLRLRELGRGYVAFARGRTGTWRLLGHIAVVQHPAVQIVHRERVDSLAAAFGERLDLRVAMAGLLGLLEGVTRLVLDDDTAPEHWVDELERLAWAGLSGLLGVRPRELAG